MLGEVGLSRVFALIAVVMAAILAVGSPCAFASPAAIGSLMGSKNATLDGQVPLPQTALLSGDRLQVKDGIAVVTLDQGNRMALGRETEASFLKDADAVTVALKQGELALYHPQSSTTFSVKAGNVTVAPEKGYRTLGEIAMADGALMIMAKDGVLEVDNAGTTQEVSKGKTITIAAPAGSAPEPVPQGNRHLKHILRISPALLLYLGIAAETGLVAWAIVASTSGAPPPVSPTAP